MKFRSFATVCAGILGLLLAACDGSSGGGKASSNELTQLGFYTVVRGKAMYVAFKAYGSGSTRRSLSASDFPDLPVLRRGDNMLLFGALPEQPMWMTVEVFPYELAGGNYQHREADQSLAAFFAQIPGDPVLGQQVLKLQPHESVKSGTYFLHKYVGMTGDAYLGFRIER